MPGAWPGEPSGLSRMLSSSDSMMQRNANVHRSESFRENMSKLSQVFPNVPEDVVDTVLRQHQGNLQNASEALLASEGGEEYDSLVNIF